MAGTEDGRKQIIQRGGILQSPGLQLQVSQAELAAGFSGQVIFHGHGELCLSGDFGDTFRGILTWTQSVPLPEHSVWSVWPELRTEGEVRVRLRAFFRNSGSREVTGTDAEEDLEQPLFISAGDGMRLALSLEASGNGKLFVGAVHLRQAVQGGDAFVRSARRGADARGEEFYTCFGSLDRKPPLNVFFSARRAQEGFDSLDYLYSLGCPFLVISDPRLGGGCGYLGSSEYETKLKNRITGAMGTLGFDNSQVIFAGSSMGVAGALYYGGEIHPRAMVLGRPLINLGEVALREKIWRPGGFPASLDILQKLTGGVSRECAEQLNRRMWEKVDKGRFDGTEIAAAYMQEDDYDPTAYLDLLHHLRGKKAKVYGKGFEGRHNDNQDEVREWLRLRHRRLLWEKFGRS